MTAAINRTCPFCERDTVVQPQEYSLVIWRKRLGDYHEKGDYHIISTAIVCPNKDCQKLSLSIELKKHHSRELGIYHSRELRTYQSDGGRRFKQFELLPHSKAKSFPDYIPETIRKNYEEACLIVSLSPNASATLARRCLQGMIRDFHKIEKSNLHLEIKALEKMVDSDVWRAIDKVRQMGNIGAHMDKDVNLMVDVECGEAEMLIWLIEDLIEDWYIRRHAREEKLAEIADIPSDKQIRAQKEKEDEAGADGITP